LATRANQHHRSRRRCRPRHRCHRCRPHRPHQAHRPRYLRTHQGLGTVAAAAAHHHRSACSWQPQEVDWWVWLLPVVGLTIGLGVEPPPQQRLRPNSRRMLQLELQLSSLSRAHQSSRCGLWTTPCPERTSRVAVDCGLLPVQSVPVESLWIVDYSLSRASQSSRCGLWTGCALRETPLSAVESHQRLRSDCAQMRSDCAQIAL